MEERSEHTEQDMSEGEYDDEDEGIDLANMSPEELEALLQEHPELAEHLMAQGEFDEEEGEYVYDDEEGEYLYDEEEGEMVEYDDEGEEEMPDEEESAVSQQKSVDMEANPEFLKLPPLDPLRKIRRLVLNAVNKLRAEEDLPPVELDLYLNETATKYAEFCSSGEVDGNPEKFSELVASSTAPGDYKPIIGYRYLEEEELKNAKLMINKLFLEAYGLTFEINETREEILKPEYTHVGIGLSSADNVYVVTEIFSSKLVTITSIKPTENEKGIEIKGKLTTDQMGPYAVRVIDESKTPAVMMALMGPDSMQLNLETKDFQVFIDKPDLIYASPPLTCEIYLRQKPQSIEYGKEPAADLEKNLVYLKLSYKMPVEMFPDPRAVVEESRERIQQEQEEIARKKMEELERQSKLSKMRDQEALLMNGIQQLQAMERMGETDGGSNYDSFGVSLDGSLSKSMGSASEDKKEGSAAGSNEDESFERHSNKSFEEKKDEEGKPEEKFELNEHETRLMDEMEKQEREEYEKKIMASYEEYAGLKKENEALKSDVAVFLHRKGIQPAAGDASMNKLKYINALVNVTQVRVQMRQTEESYKKMSKELEDKLNQHKTRSEKMKSSFKDFKRAVAESAEFNRTGKKIPKPELLRWEREEDKVDEELQNERFLYINNKRKLKQLEEELKKKDKLAEGLHVIDFEQLKIENQTLNEKIEERNENIHNLNTKIRKGVITYTHMREKLYQLNKEVKKYEERASKIRTQADKAEKDKTIAKNNRMKEEVRLQRMRKEVGFLEVNKDGKNKIDGKLVKIGIKDLELQEVNLMDEHKKTEDEIKYLQEVELPKWEKRRREAENAIRQVKMLKSQTGN